VVVFLMGVAGAVGADKTDGIDRMVTEKAANLAESRMKAIAFFKDFYRGDAKMHF
jgi:hypothetical protein